MSIQAINEEYNRQLLQIEKQRLERLAQLAARQPPKDASETYELLFRLAIANNLFAEAEPVAHRVIKAATASPSCVSWPRRSTSSLPADSGDYDESLAELRGRSVDSRSAGRPAQ